MTRDLSRLFGRVTHYEGTTTLHGRAAVTTPASDSSARTSRTPFLSEADEDILIALATYRCLTRQQLMRLLGKTGRPDFW